MKLKKYLGKYDRFLVTYGDGLSNINIKKPYLICNSKSNNKFRIKEYKTNNTIIYHPINISNGYYEDFSDLEDFLNNNYFYKSPNNIDNNNILQSVYFLSVKSSNRDSSNNFLQSLIFKIDRNTQQSIFELDQKKNRGNWIVDDEE